MVVFPTQVGVLFAQCSFCTGLFSYQRSSAMLFRISMFPYFTILSVNIFVLLFLDLMIFR